MRAAQAAGASQAGFSIADPPIIAGALTPPPLGTTTFNRVPLLTFTDADPFVHFTATVSWGDGTTSVLGETTDSNTSPIVLNVEPGAFVWTVYGSHTYTSPLSGATFSVQVSDNYGSTAVASDTDFTVEDTPPAVTSINCASNQLAPGATSLQFDVTFNEAVTGLTASDFALSGGGSSATISSLSGSGASYLVTVTGVSGGGTLGLNLADSAGVVDDFGTPMGGFGAGNQTFTGQQYALSTDFYWSGGSGQWGGDNWNVGSTSGPLSTWVNDADAIFPPGTGTVTVAGQITANSLDFEGDGATLQGSSSGDSLSLVANSGSSLPCGISLAEGTATVNVALGSSAALAISGGGVLALGGADTFSGAIVVGAGSTLSIANSGSLDDRQHRIVVELRFA